MNTQPEMIKNNMTAKQKNTLRLFKERLARALPKVQIEWAKAYNEDIIELYVEYDKDTYKNDLKAATLATEVAEETGVTIILL
jgi:hypothetical protein